MGWYFTGLSFSLGCGLTFLVLWDSSCLTIGRLMETLAREAKEDPKRLDSEEFRNVLAQASEEWAEIALEFNGGNDSSYNLCRMGKYIESIRRLCQKPDHYAPSRQINWECVLYDIEYVSKMFCTNI